MLSPLRPPPKPDALGHCLNIPTSLKALCPNPCPAPQATPELRGVEGRLPQCKHMLATQVPGRHRCQGPAIFLAHVALSHDDELPITQSPSGYLCSTTLPLILVFLVRQAEHVLLRDDDHGRVVLPRR